jgi:hypothetical protein
MDVLPDDIEKSLKVYIKIDYSGNMSRFLEIRGFGLRSSASGGLPQARLRALRRVLRRTACGSLRFLGGQRSGSNPLFYGRGISLTAKTKIIRAMCHAFWR